VPVATALFAAAIALLSPPSSRPGIGRLVGLRPPRSSSQSRPGHQNSQSPTSPPPTLFVVNPLAVAAVVGHHGSSSVTPEPSSLVRWGGTVSTSPATLRSLSPSPSSSSSPPLCSPSRERAQLREQRTPLKRYREHAQLREQHAALKRCMSVRSCAGVRGMTDGLWCSSRGWLTGRAPWQRRVPRLAMRGRVCYLGATLPFRLSE
jgi:hypothetical protein